MFGQPFTPMRQRKAWNCYENARKQNLCVILCINSLHWWVCCLTLGREPTW